MEVVRTRWELEAEALLMSRCGVVVWSYGGGTALAHPVQVRGSCPRSIVELEGLFSRRS